MKNKKKHNVLTFIADRVNDISTSFKHEHAKFLRHSTTLELQKGKKITIRIRLSITKSYWSTPE